MSSKNILRLLNAAIADGGELDLEFGDNNLLTFGTGTDAAGDATLGWDGTQLNLLPIVDDSIFKIGNGTLSFDVWVYGSSAAAYVSWDASADRLKLEDSVGLWFGTGAGAGPGNAGDIRMYWDATILSMVPVADDSVFKIGDGTNSMDVWLYGNIVTAYAEWDASASQLGLFGPVRPRGFNSLSTRHELKWVAGVRGKPGVNTDIQNSAESVRMIADPDFEVLGTSADTTTVTHGVEGGIVLTTKTTSADQVIILPHLDTSQSGWSIVTWGTDQSTEWECFIQTPATITLMTVWAGLKLTNTSTTVTDNDQAFFRFQPSVNSGKWQAVYSIGGTDTEGDAGVTVAASTQYHLKVTISSTRIARFYINGVLVATSTALTNATDLIPYIGVETGTTAARALTVYGQSISRVAA